jgi:putative heme iron utilization protein
MSSAEVARTITSLITYGTLCTTTDDNIPLGTFVTFVLDSDGHPILRLRADAVHTANLKSRPQCTLFAHAAETPARQLARVTLLGSVEELSEEEALNASARHADISRDALGVDAPHPDDTFMRLKVDKCFFVAGLGVRD